MARLQDIESNTVPFGGPGMRHWSAIACDLSSRYVVKSLLEIESLALIYGPSGSGKSFLTFHMLAAIARGGSFFGLRTKPGTVVYVAVEGARSGARRKAAYVQHHGLTASIPFWQCDRPLNLLDEQSVSEFIDLMRLIKPTVIALDTLNRAAPGIEENSSKDMGSIIAAADLIRTMTGAAVLLVHHTGKNVGNGPRGHSSLFAAVDTVIEVENVSAGNKASLVKSRDGSTGLEMNFDLKVVTLGNDEDGDPVTSCVVVETPPSTDAGYKRGRLPDMAVLILQAIEMAASELPADFPARTGRVPFLAGTPCTTIDAAKHYAEQLGTLDRSGPAGTYRSRWFKGLDPLKKRGIVEVWGDRICVVA